MTGFGPAGLEEYGTRISGLRSRDSDQRAQITGFGSQDLDDEPLDRGPTRHIPELSESRLHARVVSSGWRPSRLTLVRLAPARLAPFRVASCSIAPARLAPSKRQLVRSAPVRRAPLRSAPRRSKSRSWAPLRSRPPADEGFRMAWIPLASAGGTMKLIAFPHWLMRGGGEGRW